MHTMKTENTAYIAEQLMRISPKGTVASFNIKDWLIAAVRLRKVIGTNVDLTANTPEQLRARAGHYFGDVTLANFKEILAVLKDYERLRCIATSTN